jgi:hypothetical protein
MEAEKQKRVVPVIVGQPDLSRLPLLAGKNHIRWSGNAEEIARRLYATARPEPKPKVDPKAKAVANAKSAQAPVMKPLPPLFAPYELRPVDMPPKRGFLEWLFGGKLD